MEASHPVVAARQRLAAVERRPLAGAAVAGWWPAAPGAQQTRPAPAPRPASAQPASRERPEEAPAPTSPAPREPARRRVLGRTRSGEPRPRPQAAATRRRRAARRPGPARRRVCRSRAGAPGRAPGGRRASARGVRLWLAADQATDQAGVRPRAHASPHVQYDAGRSRRSTVDDRGGEAAGDTAIRSVRHARSGYCSRTDEHDDERRTPHEPSSASLDDQVCGSRHPPARSGTGELSFVFSLPMKDPW